MYDANMKFVVDTATALRQNNILRL